MRAVTLDGFDAAPGLRDDLPMPSPGANDVLVGIQASSVNPADAAIASGMLKGMAEYEFPVTLGQSCQSFRPTLDQPDLSLRRLFRIRIEEPHPGGQTPLAGRGMG